MAQGSVTPMAWALWRAVLAGSIFLRIARLKVSATEMVTAGLNATSSEYGSRSCKLKHDPHGTWVGSNLPGGELMLICDEGYSVQGRRQVTLVCSNDAQWPADPWCENIDDCDQLLYGCGPAGLCVDHVGTYECLCEVGSFMHMTSSGEPMCAFKGHYCDGRNCGAHGICVDVDMYQDSFDAGNSSYRCSCAAGYIFDGSRCSRANCGTKHDEHGRWSGSSHFGGEYTLTCSEGYTVWGGNEQAITLACPKDGTWDSHPSCSSAWERAKAARFESFRFWLNIVMSFTCVCTAACAAGLTLGLVSLEPRELEIIQAVQLCHCSTPEERKRLMRNKDAAKCILPLLNDPHLLLVTLLLLNSCANEALPVFLDELMSPLCAVLLSVTFVLICGEVFPSAVITGPLQLVIASRFVGFVTCLETLFYIIAKPIAVILDCGLPHKGDDLYSRAQIRAVLRLHAMEMKQEEEGELETDGTTRTVEVPSPRKGDKRMLYCVAPETEEVACVEPPLNQFEAQLCCAALDLGQTPVASSHGFRSLKPYAIPMQASSPAKQAAAAALKQGCEAVVVCESLENIRWPEEVLHGQVHGVLSAVETLAVSPATTLASHCSNNRRQHTVSPEQMVTEILKLGLEKISYAKLFMVEKDGYLIGFLDGELALEQMVPARMEVEDCRSQAQNEAQPRDLFLRNVQPTVDSRRSHHQVDVLTPVTEVSDTGFGMSPHVEMRTPFVWASTLNDSVDEVDENEEPEDAPFAASLLSENPTDLNTGGDLPPKEKTNDDVPAKSSKTDS